MLSFSTPHRTSDYHTGLFCNRLRFKLELRTLSLVRLMVFCQPLLRSTGVVIVWAELLFLAHVTILLVWQLQGERSILQLPVQWT